nr:isoform 2 of putative receptor-like protein kinase [Quercus suber]
MLVYEYVDNGNLYQWLHENPEEVSPLPWNIRMKIIQGIAKGLAYLHEDLEPKPHLIEWLKSMVVNQKIDNVVDPKLSEIPCSKELKRIVLVALRCVDPDIKDRPNMGDVIHMLEPCDMILNNGSRIRRETSHGNYLEERVVAIADNDPNRTDQGESGSESLPVNVVGTVTTDHEGL